MRIGIDARFLGASRSGVAHYSEDLLIALSQVDHETHFVVFVSNHLKRKLRLGDNFTIVPVGGHPLSVLSMIRFSYKVHAESLDLLHVHFPLAPVFAPCPVMITVHDMVPFSHNLFDFGIRFRLWRWLCSYFLYPWSIHKAKWIVCVSGATRQALREMFPETFHKSLVVQSGVGDEFRAPVEPATAALVHAHLKLPGKYLLYSGSLRQDKNIQGLLKAYALLRQQNPQFEDLHLVMEVMGNDFTPAPIEKMIHQYELDGYVKILRNIGDEERCILFHDALLLLILSRQEGFGFPILQAQLTGLPIIAAESGALPEVAGEGAILVDPDKLEDIADKIKSVLEDDELRAYLVAKGFANAGHFNWTKAAAALQQMYRLLF